MAFSGARPVATTGGGRTRWTALAWSAALIALTPGIATAQNAAAPLSDPLPYSKGYLITGNYVVGGTDLTPQANPADANGFATGTVNISGVPADADVVAAFLYWEEIFTPIAGRRPAAGVKFRGTAISPTAIKASSFPIANNPATCWGAAGTSTALVAEFRADVLYLLSKRFDVNNTWTGKYLVNGSYAVTLPEISGNRAIQSAGATLVIVYRSLSEPLRKIVIYDGAYPQPEGTTVTQRLRGFYQSAAAKSAQLTYIVGTGGNNQTEQVSFNGTVVSTTDPFPQTSPSSDRSWANPSYVVSPLMPGTNANDGFGETATTAIMSGSNPAACRTSVAVIFSTAVADVDGDGIPDGLEDASSALNDPPTVVSPAGTPLPNLHAMGASSSHKDLFVEINAMWAPSGTSYGAAGAPYSSSITTLTDTAGHNHLPTPDVLKMIGDAYAAHGLTPHFDVGDVAAYHNLGPAYVCSGLDSCNADPYLVPSAYARGGERIKERACSASDPNAVNCEFPAFPGTVGWKIGLQLYRDAPVGDTGEELTVPQIHSTWKSGLHRRRFDPIRTDYFHYVLYAHARGKPKSNLPCLDANGPASYGSNGTCALPLSDNPNYHVPLSVSGVADLPGNSVLITLGLWENFTGTGFVQASTTLHELGHNLNLWHGGLAAIFGDSAAGTPTYIEPNCKPNYLSSMNYLFQVHGLFDNAGAIHLDYSSTAANNLDETFLPDAAAAPLPPYVPAWFAPATSQLAQTLEVSPAKRFCNGPPFNSDPSLVPSPMARVFGASTTAAIDWNGNGLIDSASQQNVNFDGTAAGIGIITTPLKGFNDWASIRLDQIGAGRAEMKFSDGDFLDIGSGDFLDFGSGDFLDIGSGDFLDFGSGDFLDIGSGDFLDFGSGDFLDIGSGDFLDIGSGDFLDIGSGDFLDIGSGDFLDFGSGDFLDIGSGSPAQELDFDKARAIGRAAAFAVQGCVINTTGCLTVPKTDPTALHVLLHWSPPPFGQVAQYLIFSKDAASNKPFMQIGTSATPAFVDPNQTAGGKTFDYYVKTEFSDETPHAFSGKSNIAVVVIPKS
jgi:hypothetical protein